MTSKVLDLQSDLNSFQRGLIQNAQSWGEKELEPVIAKHWENATFPSNSFSSFVEQCPNLIGYTLPKKYGGKGYDLLTSCHISRTLASIDASFTTSLLVQYGLACESILLCGNEDQKNRFLPSMAKLDYLGCFCLTEPQSGSDASDLRTTAHKVPGGYHISGSKRWIGNALSAEVFVVWARNMSIDGNPVMGFVLQRSHQQKNPAAIATTKIEGKISLRIVQNANVEFRNAFCPDDNVMMDYVGFGPSVGRVLEASRISVAWVPVGICMGAVEKTITYANERDAFGAVLSSNQLIQEKLARMTAMVASMYLLIERVTKDFINEKCSLAAISMAKAYNTRIGREIVAICREILGGNGIVLDYGIASKFCDMESAYTYEGTYDICMLVCGRTLTGISAIKSATAMQNKSKTRQQRSKL